MVIAVDIGGTKTLIALFNDEGEILKNTKLVTLHHQDAFLEALVARIAEEYMRPNVHAISIAAAGTIDHNGVGLRFGNLPWKNIDFKKALAQFNVPVFVGTDANVGALYEVHSLPQRPRLAVYVAIGTGIGTGIVVDGHPYGPLEQSEGGHMVLNWQGELRAWETFASGKAIMRDFNQMASDITDQAIWQQIAERVAAGILAIVPLLQPDVILVGGGVGAHFEKFSAHLAEHLAKNLTHMSIMPKIVKCQHPEEAVVYGCYYYATKKLGQ